MYRYRIVSPSALPTFFRLAETVEEKGFKNAADAQKLKDRIALRVNRIPETVQERKDRLMQQNMVQHSHYSWYL